MTRNRHDLRTVFYLAAMVALLAYQWSRPGICNWWLYPLTLYFSFAAAVISHNHNHLATFRSRRLNLLTNYVLGLFYGHPVIGWIPTHNQNHHVYNNREGDVSRSPKLFKGNHLLSLAVYPTLTSLAQSRLIYAWLGELRRRNRRLFWSAISEYVVFFGLMIGAFVLDWKKAVFLLVIPQQAGLFAIQTVNFWQHIEADAESEWNHSRNFTGDLLNALLFENGFHTVHHLTPGAHWSTLRALHREHASKIAPVLNQSAAHVWIARTYFAPLLGLRAAEKLVPEAALTACACQRDDGAQPLSAIAAGSRPPAAGCSCPDRRSSGDSR